MTIMIFSLDKNAKTLGSLGDVKLISNISYNMNTLIVVVNSIIMSHVLRIIPQNNCHIKEKVKNIMALIVHLIKRLLFLHINYLQILYSMY